MKQLGFGCVRLTYHLTYKKAISNLQTAFDSGITHFDVARLYGFGTAEKILGRFIKDKRNQVTITSKFGFYPGNPLMGNLYIQNFSRFAYRLLKKVPVKTNVQSTANEIILHKNFSLVDAQTSLETSLKALRTDYLDYYLLHEPTINETLRSDLIDFLDKQKQRGTIREYGLGSFANKIEADIGSLPKSYTVVQTDCSFPFSLPFDKNEIASKKVFFFSPFRYYHYCKKLLENDSQLTNQISEKLNADVYDNLIDLFLIHQLHQPLDSTTLFTSSNNLNIKLTAKKWHLLQQQPLLTKNVLDEISLLLKSKLLSTI